MLKVLSLVFVFVVVCTEGYIAEVSSSQLVPEARLRERGGHAETPEVRTDGESPVLSSRLAGAKGKSMDIVGSAYHDPQAQHLVKSIYRRDADLNKAKRNCQRCLNGIYCKEMKKCKICRKMCKEAGIPMPNEEPSNATTASTTIPLTTESTLAETTEEVAAVAPLELQERFGGEPGEAKEPVVGEPEELLEPVVGEPEELQEPLVGELEENFIKNPKELEPETLNDETMVSAMKDGKAFRLEPEFYTVGSFGPGPVKDLMERLLNINEDQSSRILRLIVIGQTKTTYQDEQAVILDSVHAFDGHVPIIVSVTKGRPRQLEIGNGGKPSVSRDQLESIIDQVMKELKDTPEVLPKSVSPKLASPDLQDNKKRPGHFNDYDIDDNGEGFPPIATSARPPIIFRERQAAPLSSENQVKDREDFRVENNEVNSPEEIIPKEDAPSIPEGSIAEETIPRETFQEERIPEEITKEERVPTEIIREERIPEERIPEETALEERIRDERIPEARIPSGMQNPEVGTPEQTSNARANLEKSIIDVVENSLKDLRGPRLEESNPEDMMRRMERPLERMEIPLERMESPSERMELSPMERIERGSMEVMQEAEQRPMEQRPVGEMEPSMEPKTVSEPRILGENEQQPEGRMEPVRVTEPRPVGGMEQRFREEVKPAKTMQANGPATRTFRIPFPEEPESDQVSETPKLTDEEFEQKIEELATPKIHVKDLPEEFPTTAATNLQARMSSDAESSAEEFNRFGELVPRDGQPGNVFFVGKDIKLPLTLVKDKSGRVKLTVDMDRLCSCKNQTCTKPHLEEMIPQIRHERSLEPDFVNSIEHVFDNKKDEDEDELVKLNEEYQFRQLEEKLEDKLDKLNKDVDKYNEENETLLNKGTLALFKNVEKAKNVEKTIDLVNTVLSWMKNMTIRHAAN